MGKLLSFTHIFILLWTSWEVWTKYDNHVNAMENLTDRIPIFQQKIKKINKQLASLKTYYKDIDAAKEKIEKVAEKVEAIQRQFPNTISDAENLQLFSELTKGINIKDVYLTPEREDVKGFYITKEYALKASATYLQFLVFLEYLESREKLFNIKSISLSQSSQKQRGRFQLVDGDIRILAYRYNQAYKEDRGYEKIEQDLEIAEKNKQKALREQRKAAKKLKNKKGKK